jgi:RNA polymerase sigma-70 factor (ECF subfamily)
MRELDPETLAACRAGDEPAFRRLVELYQDRVYALCVALAGGEALDVAQETFARVHGALHRFDPGGAARLSTWILTIARRLCRDFAVKARPIPVGDAWPESVDEGAGPDQRLEETARLRRLREAMLALPDEQRAALVLRVWDGLEYEEIAAVEEVPVGTIRSRLARARDALATALEHEEGGRRVTRG